ncbi:MAG: NAD-dependent epimerase/dehydratase family protein [Candidatus Hodarchaeota archaeon]
MKCLVTGASGFMGSHLVERLISENYEVIAFDKNQCEIDVEFIQGDLVSYNFDDILSEVDIVFHLAGLLGTTELFHKIIEAEMVNVVGTLNLLEAMRRKKVDTIIFTSKPNVWKYNVYTITKMSCENYLKMYREIFGFKTVITKPFNVYGPREYLYEYRKAVPYFIIAALRQEPIEIFGDGTQTLDVIYIDDVIEALIRCIKKLPNKIVEIGSSKPITVNYLAKKILELTGKSSKIIYKPMRRGELGQKFICSNDSMKKLLNYTPKINLKEGLVKTIKWYETHLNEFEYIYEFKNEDFL